MSTDQRHSDTEPIGSAGSQFHWEDPVELALSATGPDDETESAADPSRFSLLDHTPWWVIIAALGAFVGARRLSDNSFLTHLATGRLILGGSAPTFDVFTWASEGEPLVAHSWGSSVLYALGDQIGSGFGVRLLTTAVVSTGFVALWRLSAPAKANVARLALVSVALVLAFAWWNERPQSLAFLALALGLIIVTEQRSVWLLFPLFVLWTNLHGSFAVGVPLLGVMMGLRVLEARSIGRREVLEICAMLSGIVVGALLSPYGVDLMVLPFRQLQLESLSYISEWQRMRFDDPQNMLFLAQAVVIAGVLAWRRAWMRLVLCLALVALSVDAVRYAPLAAIMLVPLVAPTLAGIGTDSATSPHPRRQVVAIAIAVLAVGIVGIKLATLASYDLAGFPVDEVASAESMGWVGQSRDELPRILTHDWVGNYLEWSYGIEAKPWLDDRAEVHSLEVIRDYVRLLDPKLDDHIDVIDRYEHDVVIWSSGLPFADTVRSDDRYEVLSDGDEWLVACVRTSGFCPNSG